MNIAYKHQTISKKLKRETDPKNNFGKMMFYNRKTPSSYLNNRKKEDRYSYKEDSIIKYQFYDQTIKFQKF